MGRQKFKKQTIIHHEIIHEALFFFIFFLYLYCTYYYFFNVFGIYDKDGVLRFLNSDKEACIDYAKLFELNSAHYYLIDLIVSIDTEADINLDLNQAESNN